MRRSVCSIVFALLGSALGCSESGEHRPEAEAATPARSQTAPRKSPALQTAPSCRSRPVWGSALSDSAPTTHD